MNALVEMGYIVEETKGSISSTYKEASAHTKCTPLTSNAWKVGGQPVRC
jgi:hypothetical protein